MTAHRTKSVITIERIMWFAAYYEKNPAWGVFHVCLSDGNYKCKSAQFWHRPGTGVRAQDGTWIPEKWDLGRDEWTAGLREAADWFDSLSPSQRQRLGRNAESLSFQAFITDPSSSTEKAS